MTVTLHRNYRSMQRILDVANVARPAKQMSQVVLAGVRGDGIRPSLVSCYDAGYEARAIVDRILTASQNGTPLRDQAVLMRAASHSDMLELELTARRVPFRKYGGIKFLEAAHVKDFVAGARVLSNANDDLSWFRILALHKGVGSRSASRMAELLTTSDSPDRDAEAIALAPAPARLAVQSTLQALRDVGVVRSAHDQAAGIVGVLRPLIEERYDDAATRLTDLDRLVAAATKAPDLAAFVADLTLDPPASTSDVGPPHIDEDFLILSTVHSAKGLEWSRVHVISLVDGAFPSDMSFSTPGGVEEEHRLFYVAVTRARDELFLYVPLRMPHRRRSNDDRHSFAPASRFLDDVEPLCDRHELVRETVDVPTLASTRLELPTLAELWL